jgi:hypothetical protein
MNVTIALANLRCDSHAMYKESQTQAANEKAACPDGNDVKPSFTKSVSLDVHTVVAYIA